MAEVIEGHNVRVKVETLPGRRLRVSNRAGYDARQSWPPTGFQPVERTTRRSPFHTTSRRKTKFHCALALRRSLRPLRIFAAFAYLCGLCVKPARPTTHVDNPNPFDMTNK